MKFINVNQIKGDSVFLLCTNTTSDQSILKEANCSGASFAYLCRPFKQLFTRIVTREVFSSNCKQTTEVCYTHKEDGTFTDLIFMCEEYDKHFLLRMPTDYALQFYAKKYGFSSMKVLFEKGDAYGIDGDVLVLHIER